MARTAIIIMAAVSVCMVAGLTEVNAAPISYISPEFSATIKVDEEVVALPLKLNGDGRGFTLDVAGPEEPLSFSGASISLGNVYGEFDPVLNLGAAVIDSGAPSTFQITLVAPLVPELFNRVRYLINLGGVFSDGGSDGGSIAQGGTNTHGVMDVGLDGSAVDGVGGFKAFSGPLEFYGPFSKEGTFECGAGGCGSFSISFGFTGSGNNDSYTLNGRFEIGPVPIPSTLLLFGSGIFALVGLRRRVHRLWEKTPRAVGMKT
jgi:hypothetical protein